jgi:hypothetical protein
VEIVGYRVLEGLQGRKVKKVYQTRFSPMTGNCFAACLASLLELPIEDVDFIAVEDNPKENHNWMRDEMNPILEKLGYIYFQTEVKDNKFNLHFLPNGTLFIGCGKSPRYNCNHAVILRVLNHNTNDLSKGCYVDIVHDPNPDSEEDVTEWKYLGFLLPRKIHIDNK